MEISIIGTGYVGLVSGACFAKFGNNVICVDIDKEKIEKINNSISPIHEDGLEDLLLKYKENIKATDDYNYAINNTEITFICVGTPSESDGGTDLSYVKEVAIKILIEEGKEVFYKEIEGKHIDIGTLEDLRRANDFLVKL